MAMANSKIAVTEQEFDEILNEIDGKWFCDICQTSMSSTDKEQHLVGKKHRRHSPNGDAKIKLNLVILGHVNASGKSTGLAIDVSKNNKKEHQLGKFFTESYLYTIIDQAGMENDEFIKRMISGEVQAHVALLVIPSDKWMYASMATQHARMIHLLSIKQVIVAIDNMDAKSVNWSENRYNEIKKQVGKMLTTIDYKTKKIPFIPISGCKGDNVKDNFGNMKWWKGWSVKIKKGNSGKKGVTGFTLMEALERMIIPTNKYLQSQKVFRMPVSGVYKINGVGDVITGRVEQGSIKPGADVKFYPTGCGGTVFSIEMNHKSVDIASCGDNVGVNVKKLPKENKNLPMRGDVMAIDDMKMDPVPPRAAAEFTALVFVQDYLGKLKVGLFTPSIHIVTAAVPCLMLAINWKRGKSTANSKVEGAAYIEAGDQAEVVFKPCGSRPLIAQPFAECEPLGRFAAMDANSVIMLGRVLKVTFVDAK